MPWSRAMLDGWHAEGAGPRERILSFIHMLITNRAKIMAFGCPAGTLSSEFAKLDHVAEIFGLFRDWLTGEFRAPGAGDRVDALALYLLSWSQGEQSWPWPSATRLSSAARWPESNTGWQLCRTLLHPTGQGASMFVTLLKVCNKALFSTRIFKLQCNQICSFVAVAGRNHFKRGVEKSRRSGLLVKE